MRIAIIDPSLFTLPYDHLLCQALHEAGHEVTLYARHRREGEQGWWGDYRVEPMFYRTSEKLLNHTRRAITKKLTLAAKAGEHMLDMWRLYRTLKRQRPDVIHFQWLTLPIIDRRWLRRFECIAPVILTMHDTTPLRGSASSRFQMLHQIDALHEPHRVIVHTTHSRKALLDAQIPAEKVDLVPHGLIDTIQPYAEQRRQVDDHDCCRILLFGALKPYKGLDTLIEAVGRLPEDVRQKCEVHVCGKLAMDMAPSRSRIATLGIEPCFRWSLGYLPDGAVDAVLREADVRVFPYHNVDASGALMQALPYGQAIVASKLGPFEEIMVDGEHGLFHDAGDAAGLARCLEAVVRNDALRTKLGHAAKRQADNITSWADIATMTQMVYRRCA